MNQDVLVWCLVAVAVIAVAAVAVLSIRSRAVEAKKQHNEAVLTARLGEAEGRLRDVSAELHRRQAEQQVTIRAAEEAAEDSTKAVLKGAARFLQSLAAEQMVLLEEVQRKYGGHPVLADLMEVNHANAQMARRAHGIAVMCGAPLGRRTKAASVYDVVRNAQGQIRNFRRVQIMQQTGFALKASAVSPVAHAVAELLDNPASFSQQDAPIEVTFQRVQKNLCIVIDDAGVGMNDEDRQNATALLSGTVQPRLSELGTQPKFGFPVVGRIAAQYGFRVDVTGVSRYGGVRAVVLLPEELWTEEEITAPATQAQAQAPRMSAVRDTDDTYELPRGRDRTVSGLPKRGARQRRDTAAPVREAGAPPARPAAVERNSGRSLGALQRGTLSGRNLDSTPSEGPEDS